MSAKRNGEAKVVIERLQINDRRIPDRLRLRPTKVSKLPAGVARSVKDVTANFPG